VRNRLGNINLEAMLRTALGWPNDNFDIIIEEAIPLGKNETKYPFPIC